MKRFEFNKIPVQVEGDHPVVDLIVKELSLFSSTSKSPEVKFNIVKNKIFPEEDALIVGANNYVTKDSLYLTLPFPCFVKIHLTLEGLWEVNISCDTGAIPDSFIKKILNLKPKVIDWTYLTRLERLAYGIINGIFEPFFLFLIQKDRTLLHASSLVKDGEVLLLTGLGGVGKTSASIELILNSDYKCLSDDISLIGADGTAVLYPRYVMYYAYNDVGNKKLQSKIMKGRSLVDKLQWTSMRKIRGPKGVRRRIPPEILYGRDNLGDSGHISKVVYLNSSLSKDFHLNDVNAQDLAARCMNVILSEYYYYLRYIQMWCSTGYSSVSVEEIMTQVKRIYTKAFENTECYLLFVPKKSTPQELANFIKREIL